MTPPPYLLDEELAVVTYPTIQAKAQMRFLDRIGVPYLVRPSGRPLVSREIIAERLAAGGMRPAGGSRRGPDANALKAHLAARKGRRG